MADVTRSVDLKGRRTRVRGGFGVEYSLDPERSANGARRIEYIVVRWMARYIIS